MTAHDTKGVYAAAVDQQWDSDLFAQVGCIAWMICMTMNVIMQLQCIFCLEGYYLKNENTYICKVLTSG